MENIEHSLDNADQKSYLVTISQQVAKGKYHEFFSFIPHETMEVLRGYWSTRTDQLTKESYVFVKERGKIVEPTNGGAMSQAFRKIAEKLERAHVIDYKVRKGKPSQIRLYNLRKWFRKQAYQAGSDFVNFWMGHTNLDLEHYFSKDVNVHRKVYEEKALLNMQLEAETPSETAMVIAQQTERIKALEKKLAEYEGVERELAELKTPTKKLLARVEAVEETAKK